MIRQSIDSLKNENVVFIADRIFKRSDEIDIKSETLEMIPDEYYHQVFDCLNSVAKSVTHYNTLSCFIDNISKHKNDIVFTIYGGYSSRNRMALVPAICESYKIRFVGADTYARIICQDKQISKEHCNKFGLNTAPYLLIDKFTDLRLIQNLDFPVVIKPNTEGSSIGIHQECLVSDHQDAIALSKEMLEKYKQPVLIEQFISGKEVCVCISGNTNEVNLLEAVEVFLAEDETYFYRKLYTASVKHVSKMKIKHRIITEEINNNDLEKMNMVFLSLGKMDYMRIDGRIQNGKFYLLELTPDPHLGLFSSFTEAFRKNGMSYNEMLGTFICNSLDYYQYPYSSR